MRSFVPAIGEGSRNTAAPGNGDAVPALLAAMGGKPARKPALGATWISRCLVFE
jgi:hypothetical protein